MLSACGQIAADPTTLTLSLMGSPQLGETFELIVAGEIVHNDTSSARQRLAGDLSLETTGETQGTQEVFVATVVPEPGSLAILLATIPMISLRASRGSRRRALSLTPRPKLLKRLSF
jgi:hypothetical protein